MKFKVWLHTLLVACIGGLANAMLASIVDPANLNFSGPGLHHLEKIALVGALIPSLTFLAKSPLWQFGGESDDANNRTFKSCVIFAWALLSLTMMTGCSGPSKAQVAKQIVAWLPAIDSGVQSIGSLVATFDPANAVEIQSALGIVNAASKQFETAAQAYLLHQTAGNLAALQDTITSFEQSTNAAVLVSYHVTNPQSQHEITTAIDTLATISASIMGLVESISPQPAVQAMRKKATIKLSSVSLDGVEYNRLCASYTRDTGNPCPSLDTFVQAQTAIGF